MDCVQLLRFSPRTHWIVIRVTKVTGFVKIFSALKNGGCSRRIEEEGGGDDRRRNKQ
jgi:hypothetical protein